MMPTQYSLIENLTNGALVTPSPGPEFVQNLHRGRMLLGLEVMEIWSPVQCENDKGVEIIWVEIRLC